MTLESERQAGRGCPRGPNQRGKQGSARINDDRRLPGALGLHVRWTLNAMTEHMAT